MAPKAPNNKAVQPKQRRAEEKPKKGSGFWIGLICFSSLWMFGLGILVGRGTAPVQFDLEKIQDELAGLKKAMAKREKAQFENLSKAVNKKEHLDFYDDLKKAESVVTGAVGKTDAPHDAGRKTDGPEAVQEAGVTPQETASEAGTEPLPVPETAVEKVLPADDDFRWTIQVSSLKDPAAAEKMVQDLKQKGYSAYRMASKVSGRGMWHRVRVGPFRLKEAAEKVLARLRAEKYDAILISL